VYLNRARLGGGFTHDTARGTDPYWRLSMPYIDLQSALRSMFWALGRKM
jgi:hypothetical protein